MSVAVGGRGCAVDDADKAFVGTCTEVEKRYLRLHVSSDAQPDASTVRPEAVLRQALAAVLERERNGEAYDVCKDYYMSICQDMKLQGIRSPFAVEVREAMAICALRARMPREKAVSLGPSDSGMMDVKTFSDCMLHLSYLYSSNRSQPREAEFQVYRFLFWAAVAKERPENSVHMNSAISSLSDHQQSKFVAHAFQIHSAAFIGDFSSYFKLLQSIPPETKEQIHIHESLLLHSIRDHAYLCLLKAFKFKIPCSMVQRVLGFHGQDDMKSYLSYKGAEVVKEDEAFMLDVDRSKNKTG